jgi:aurora kinase
VALLNIYLLRWLRVKVIYLILFEGYDYSIDLWAFGVLIFEVCTGNPPFQSAHDSISNKVNYPNYLSVAVVDLIDKLLV